MIRHRTFTASKWLAWRPQALHDQWAAVRDQAERFIADELDDTEVISVTESAFGNSPYGFSVTVWYRRQ
jgi:hypothetical protein